MKRTLQPRTIDKSRDADRNRPNADRRATPEIYVRVPDVEGRWYKTDYRRAHLRNKAGYLYLCWRDSSGVHSHYLGKAPKTSPT